MSVVPETFSIPVQTCEIVEPLVFRTAVQLVTAAGLPLVRVTELQNPAPQSLVTERTALTPLAAMACPSEATLAGSPSWCEATQPPTIAAKRVPTVRALRYGSMCICRPFLERASVLRDYGGTNVRRNPRRALPAPQTQVLAARGPIRPAGSRVTCSPNKRPHRKVAGELQRYPVQRYPRLGFTADCGSMCAQLETRLLGMCTQVSGSAQAAPRR